MCIPTRILNLGSVPIAAWKVRAQLTASIALWKLERAPSPRSLSKRPLNRGRKLWSSSR